jgi:peptidoglycan hydrolase-like protein with peptidoglycan-binding domain
MSLLKNKLFVLFITLAFLASGLAFAQTASAITLGELVELFIALGVIAPDKVDAARSIIQEESPLPSSCISLSYNHYLGRSDSETNGEVSKLQNYLKQTGDYSYPEITGYYGPSTQSAVQSWQSRNGVVSSGTPDSTGYGLVGPQTRRVMGCKEVIATQNNSCRGVTIPVRPDFCTQGSEPIYNVQGCQTGWRCSQTDQDINENYNYDTINNTQYPTLPTPFIAVGANPSSINSGQGASLSWNATNAIRCVLRFNSSEEVISVSGAKFVTPNQTTIYTIWCANDPGDGKDGPSASASVSVTVGGSQLATRATYNGYKDGAQFINTQSITRADALANCQLNHKNNPGSSIRCTWGSEQIYNRGSLLPVEIDVEEV